MFLWGYTILVLKSESDNCSFMSHSLQPRGLQPPRLLCTRNSPGKNTGMGSHSLLQGDLPSQGIEPRSPALQADSFPCEPPGQSKNTGMGSLSLLQRIFATQELNRGFLHCRRILYQLNYQGNQNNYSLKKFSHIVLLQSIPSPLFQSQQQQSCFSITLPFPEGHMYGITQYVAFEICSFSFFSNLCCSMYKQFASFCC